MNRTIDEIIRALKLNEDKFIVSMFLVCVGIVISYVAVPFFIGPLRDISTVTVLFLWAGSILHGIAEGIASDETKTAIKRLDEILEKIKVERNCFLFGIFSFEIGWCTFRLAKLVGDDSFWWPMLWIGGVIIMLISMLFLTGEFYHSIKK